MRTAPLILLITLALTAAAAHSAPIILEAEDYVGSFNVGGDPITVTACSGARLSRKYAAVEAHGDAPGRARVAFGDEEDDYLNRGIRDFLFPWKG